ncbi:MAG: hypothetical protein L0G94_08860 [Brachybacterium sp.]|uniref:hypothetical protein n=1 Tax=Brachybacterium sp. TaxID=1891286 RepID=UPI0026471D47|nr:hypothetical protein [Brachybacterium sp.]MDN5686776.1 hypothetical protein [Brachybacterium sp.]
MSFTVVSGTDLARSAARLRPLSCRVERRDFTTQSERELAVSIGTELNRAGRHIEDAHALLPESGLDFHQEGNRAMSTKTRINLLPVRNAESAAVFTTRVLAVVVTGRVAQLAAGTVDAVRRRGAGRRTLFQYGTP